MLRALPMEPTQSGQDSEVPEGESLAGTILDGKYLIGGELGAGGMGVVYEGHNLAIGRRVAIKLLHPCYANHAEAVQRFEREAHAAGPIAHPSVVEVLDMGRTEVGLPYLVMEHLEGVGLYERLLDGGPLPPEQAVHVVLQVLGALAAAHAVGVVHRDVKPENVFLARRGEEAEVVKILDFGVAMFSPPRSISPERLTRSGLVVGTPGYMSPEQALGVAVDERSDLYSAAVLLYELLSGKLPDDTQGKSPAIPILRVAPRLSAALADVIGKGLAVEPDLRFQTAAAFMEALAPFVQASACANDLGPPPAVVDPPTRPTSAMPWLRWPLPRWLGVVLAASLSLAATLAYLHTTEAHSSVNPPATAGASDDQADRLTKWDESPPAGERKGPMLSLTVDEVPPPAKVGRVRRTLPFGNVY